jgi:hypothetical protein
MNLENQIKMRKHLTSQKIYKKISKQKYFKNNDLIHESHMS